MYVTLSHMSSTYLGQQVKSVFDLVELNDSLLQLVDWKIAAWIVVRVIEERLDGA